MNDSDIYSLNTNNLRCRECQADSGYHVKPITYHTWSRNDIHGTFIGVYCDDCNISKGDDFGK